MKTTIIRAVVALSLAAAALMAPTAANAYTDPAVITVSPSVLTVGDTATARELFAWAQQMRVDDGRYWTGTVYPEDVHFPENETSSYTAAAVVLAADALAGTNPGSTLFTTFETLPPILPVDDILTEDAVIDD